MLSLNDFPTEQRLWLGSERGTKSILTLYSIHRTSLSENMVFGWLYQISIPLFLSEAQDKQSHTLAVLK